MKRTRADFQAVTLPHDRASYAEARTQGVGLLWMGKPIKRLTKGQMEAVLVFLLHTHPRLPNRCGRDDG